MARMEVVTELQWNSSDLTSYNENDVIKRYPTGARALLENIQNHQPPPLLSMLESI